MSADQQFCGDAAVHSYKAFHKPFSFLRDSLRDERQAKFAETTFNICQGISTCLELVHSSDLERHHNMDASPGEESVPVLDPADTERLLAFAREAAQLLADRAERHIGLLNDDALRKEANDSKGRAA